MPSSIAQRTARPPGARWRSAATGPRTAPTTTDTGFRPDERVPSMPSASRNISRVGGSTLLRLDAYRYIADCRAPRRRRAPQAVRLCSLRCVDRADGRRREGLDQLLNSDVKDALQSIPEDFRMAGLPRDRQRVHLRGDRRDHGYLDRHRHVEPAAWRPAAKDHA